ncbi:acylneuraminate cytidylyltransferase family protein [Chitinophaga deserti]|uniref:acylneuraminate cytidylyltransferase family protein n=1 Tax=Chitinophaga deserti TaxID=2164099 RepID=UPI000D6AFDFB|nr:acylneuraminate cytidylyltransferase family protein [Chitinophaga deserti]
MSVLITICARGGSKGIPGKNIRPLGGKPLISYSIEIAQRFASLNNGTVGLSTDAPDIRSVAASFGLETEYIRPEALSGDTVGKIDTIRDILLFEESRKGSKFDYILDLDVTSPLRTIEDLTSAFELIRQDAGAVNIFSVNKAGRNPYFNMVERNPEGYYSIVKKLNSPTLSRQSAPAVYEMNASFYFYRRDFFEQSYTSPVTDLSLIYEMPHVCFDLDHPVDFDFMEFLFVNHKLGFELT